MNNFAFKKRNYQFLAIGMLIIIVGFILMSGPSSTETHFEPDIFSPLRIRVAPVVSLVGFLFIMFAIMYRSNKSENTEK